MFRSIIVLGLIGTSALFVGGCAVEAGPGQEESAVGTVEMNLIGTTGSGVVYRLRNAEFVVAASDGSTSAVLNSEDGDPNATTLSTNLPLGGYMITLNDGWSMERVSDGQLANAALTTPATTSFQIFLDQATQVSYAFKIEGEPLVLGGSLNVSIRVGECRLDPWEPNDTREQATPLALPTSGSVCGNDDWFTFSTQGVPDGTIVALNLEFLHANGDLDMRLFLPDGSSIVSQSTTDNERIEFAATPGEYALRVYGFQGAVGDYTLNADVLPAP